MGRRQTEDKASDARYAAFISYAHTDEVIAAKLHSRLENFPLRDGLASKKSLLKPIFRDVTELTAHHSLPEKIKEAVQGSRKLIVLCSPAAKTSHWVNEEIRLFRETHGDGAILAALTEGTPDTAFPPALLEGGREPLAADLKGRDGLRFGTVQLAASLLGVGLDRLVQREARRRRRLTQIVTASALGFSAIMGAMTLTALKAQNAAQENRAQAEDLVEYMITDLKAKLEPVGRLDILDGVGDKIVSYYGDDIKAMPAERIARYARARHILGQVALDSHKFSKADTELSAAYALTEEVLARSPNDTMSIFAHSQSAFWIGESFVRQSDASTTSAMRENKARAKPYWQNYKTLSQRLYTAAPDNFDWIMEMAWAENNLGKLAFSENNYEEAERLFLSAINLFEAALEAQPGRTFVREELANSLVGAGNASLGKRERATGLEQTKKAIDIYDQLIAETPNNYDLKGRRAAASITFLHTFETNTLEVQQGWEEVASIYRDLVDHDPLNGVWKSELFDALLHLGLCEEAQSYKADMSPELLRAFKKDTRINCPSVTGITDIGSEGR